MGEVVVSSEAGIEIEVVETESAQKVEKQDKITKITEDDGGTTAEVEATGGSLPVVRWERFLPKMVMRVLLVEADDSTRQIIAALLRKCSYRVAAVSDGLKAWEVLKGSLCNIDLIITEVELPSISGYALLTLIMEHEACKKIPVIMMSSQDSVSTVYKCMLKGATDFLVKPVRKNELRNVWQHVWRKQASSIGAGFRTPDESVQQKDVTSAENNAFSNHSSGFVSCIQRNKHCPENGSDDQSSCTKPEPEFEEEDIENRRCFSQQQQAEVHSDVVHISSRQEEYPNVLTEKRACENEISETHAVADINAENSGVLVNPYREAIDLIGTFDNQLKGNVRSLLPNDSANKFDVLPLLDLSLRRPHHSGSVNQPTDKWHRLNHSGASAFSRYINKLSVPFACNNDKDQETNLENESSNYSPENHTYMHSIQTGIPEMTFSYSGNKEVSHPIPVKGVRFENTNSPYHSLISSPHTRRHTESFPQSSLYYLSDHHPSISHQVLDKQIDNSENKVDNMEAQNGNFCSGDRSQDKAHAIKDPSEYACHEESSHARDEASKRSMQREVALNKFRLKRKDRCFEKKVRYESRKKLAEQRPRVKGQFVRQVLNESQLL